MDLRLLWLALGAFALATDGFVIGSLLPGIAADTGVTVAQAGYVVFAASMAGGIATPILAAIFGAGDRRLVLTVSTALFALFALLVALAPDYTFVLVTRAALAVGGALYVPIAQAAAVAMAPPDMRGRAVATVVLGMSVAVAVGAPLGAWFATYWGWRSAYLMMAALSAFATVMVWLNVPSGLSGTKITLRERLAVAAAPGIPRALLGAGLFMLGGFAAVVYIGPLTTEAMRLEAGMIPLVLLLYGIGAVAGNWAGGQLADRAGSYRATVIFMAGQVIGLLLFSVIPFLPGPLITPVYLVHVCLFALVGWGYYVAQISRVSSLAGDAAPLALSLLATVITFAIAFAAVVGSTVLERLGVLSIGWIAALLPAAALVLLLLESRQQRIPAPAEG